MLVAGLPPAEHTKAVWRDHIVKAIAPGRRQYCQRTGKPPRQTEPSRQTETAFRLEPGDAVLKQDVGLKLDPGSGRGERKARGPNPIAPEVAGGCRAGHDAG